MTDFTFKLSDARERAACYDGYNRLVCRLKAIEYFEHNNYIDHDDVTVSIIDVLDSGGIDDALWALHCVKGKDRDIVLFAVWCARQVQHLMTDEMSINALDVAELFANGQETEDELSAASTETWTAASTAAWDAAWAAWAAASTAEMDAALEAQKQMLIKMCNGQAPWQVDEMENQND